MKKWLFFGGGVLTGFILTSALAIIIAANTPSPEGSDNNKAPDNGVTLFDKAGDIVSEPSFQVFQVVGEDAALTHGKSNYGDIHMGTVYLLTNNEGKYYYDDEIVKVPNGKVVRQIGIYRYLTKNDFEKTVPIVQIVDK